MKKALIIALILTFTLIGINAIAAPKKPVGPELNPPSNLSTEAVSASQINLTWQDNSPNETGFKIERSLDGQNFAEIVEVDSNVISYSDTGLEKLTTYYYQVRAFKVSGKKTTYSDYSNIASATTFGPPEAPTNLTAEYTLTTTTPAIILNWQDNSPDEDGFSIERALNSGSFEKIATTTPNEITYEDYDIETATSTTYYYRVRAFNPWGYSDYSNIASVTTADVLPTAPSDLDAVFIPKWSPTSTPYISLTWTDNSDNETGFSIERGTDGINFVEIDTVGVDVFYYSDYNIVTYTVTTYYYRIRAFNDFGYSDYSNIASATTFGETPAAPTNLTAEFTLTTTTPAIILNWQDNSTDEDGFSIERGPDGVSFGEIYTTDPNETTYEDYDIVTATSTTYYYRVRAFNKWGYSDYSNTAQETTP